MAIFRVPGRPQRSFRFGNVDRGLDKIAKDATPAGLRQLLKANQARIEDGRGIAKGEVAWLAALCSHPAADAALISDVQGLLAQAGMTHSARETGANDFFDGLAGAHSGELPPTENRPAQNGALNLRMAVLGGKAFDFGRKASDLPRLSPGASANVLTALIEQHEPTIADGNKLARGELAWLHDVATHPNATDDIRSAIKLRFGALPLTGAASRADGEAFIKALATDDTYVPSFGAPEDELGAISDAATAPELTALITRVRKDLRDNKTITSSELAWLHQLVSTPNADATVKAHAADTIAGLKPAGGVELDDLKAFVDVLRNDKAIAPAVQFEAPAAVTLQFDAAPSEHLPAIPTNLDATALGFFLDDNRKALTGTNNSRQLDSGDVAWLIALSRAPGSNAALRRKISARVRHTKLDASARQAGGGIILKALSVGAAVLDPRGTTPSVDVHFAAPQAELGSVPSHYNTNQLRSLFDRVWPDLADGNDLRGTEMGWVHGFVTHPGADAELGKYVAQRLKSLAVAPHVNAEDAASFFDALDSGTPLFPPRAPDVPASAPFAHAFGDKDPTLPSIDAGLDAAELGFLVDDTLATLKNLGGGKIAPSGAAWLLEVAQHPNADPMLRKKIGERLRGGFGSVAVSKGGDAFIAALRTGAPLDAGALDTTKVVPATGRRVNMSNVEEALVNVRDHLLNAAGADQQLSIAEVDEKKASIPHAESVALGSFLDAMVQHREGTSMLSRAEIEVAFASALQAAKAADVDGDGVLVASESLKVGVLGATVLDLARTYALLAPGSDPFAGLVDESLKDALKDHAAIRLVLEYRPAREAMFGQLDNEDGQVRDVYTHRVITTSTIPNANGPDGINTEHTRPKSTGVRGTDAISDLHHLFPTDTRANGERSSYPFGTVVKSVFTKGESKLGWDADGRMVFEPPAEHRGNVARALFYVSTAYTLDIDAHEEATLRAWNDADPVDDKERARNDGIAQIQQNRNPFVDDEDLADRISDF